MGPRAGDGIHSEIINPFIAVSKGALAPLARVWGEEPQRNPLRLYRISTMPSTAAVITTHGTLSLSFQSIAKATRPMTMGCHAT